MIYKNHDIRIEKGHIVVKDLKTGSEWREDTISDAKKTIDIMREVKLQAGDVYGEVVKDSNAEEGI